MPIKVFGCKVVDFAGGVVFHRGGSVTNMATLSSCKRTSCEKKKISYYWNIFGAK